MHPMLLAQLLPDGDPPYHADLDGRTGHGKDEKQAQEHRDGPIGPGGHQPGDEDYDHDGESVHQQAGHRHRTGLHDATAQRLAVMALDVRACLVVVRQGDHGPAGDGDAYRGGHRCGFRYRLDDRVDLLQHQLETLGRVVRRFLRCVLRLTVA